ncbi:MAG: hypothetical protein ACFFDI_32030 [Promethearchaeota archaeon]
MPPEVEIELGRGTNGDPEQEYRGIPSSEVAAATMKALKNDKYEIFIGEAKRLIEGSKRNSKRHFKNLMTDDSYKEIRRCIGVTSKVI